MAGNRGALLLSDSPTWRSALQGYSIDIYFPSAGSIPFIFRHSPPILNKNTIQAAMQKIYYERNLPHWHPPGAAFFLTYRLYGSIPQSKLFELQRNFASETLQLRSRLSGQTLDQATYALQRRFFVHYDEHLDQNPNGPYWLKQPEIAHEVINSWSHLETYGVQIHALCIMPNHVHVLLQHREGGSSLSKILQVHKAFTGKQCNRLLRRTGHFWQKETYDHWVRNAEEFDRIVRYILNNPVKAKLVERWEDWPYTVFAQ
ncbi:MAG: transposase [Saprospiraceae bacterium]|nr:transposase [Saprospiraceae bacterium]